MMSPNIAKLVVTLLIRLYANLLYFYPIRGQESSMGRWWFNSVVFKELELNCFYGVRK